MGCLLLPLLLATFVPGILAWISFEISALPRVRSWRERFTFLLGSALLAFFCLLGMLTFAALRSGEIWGFDLFFWAILYVGSGLLLVSLLVRLVGHFPKRLALLTVANTLQLAIMLLPFLLFAVASPLIRLFGLRETY